MKRIRHLFISVIAAMALTAAIGVGSASASEFLTEGSSSVSAYGEGTFNFKSAGGASCGAPAGTAALSGHSNTLNTSIGEVGCSSIIFGGEKGEGCELSYRPGAQTGEGTYAGTIDIAPAGCGPVKFWGTCTVTMPAQSVSATFTNEGSGTNRRVRVSFSTSSLVYSQVSGSTCKNTLGDYTNGEWNGTFTLWGDSGAKGVWVGTNPISISGSGQLVSPNEKVTLNGQQVAGSPLLFKGKGGSAECGSSVFSSQVYAPATQFQASPTFGACTVIGVAGTVAMNGCSFVVNIQSETGGHADISCPAGKSISLTGSKCTTTIGAQTTDAGGITFANEANSTVKVTFSTKGIDYHQQKGTGIGACTTGDYTDGTLSGSYSMVGGQF